MFPLGQYHRRLPARLPRPLAPLPNETVDSYMRRLGAANQIQADTLHAYLNGTGRRSYVSAASLAAAVGKPVHQLRHALPELGYDSTAEAIAALTTTHTRRAVCHRCAAQRGVFTIATVWQHQHTNVCLNHQIWLGATDRSYTQFELTDAPEIITAQRRHYRLARRHGHRLTLEAFTYAARVTGRWARRGDYRHRRQPLIPALGQTIPISGKLQHGDLILTAVTYPETVDLARVLAMPQWRTPGGTDLRRLGHDIRLHTGIEYHPFESGHDPLIRWFQRPAPQTQLQQSASDRQDKIPRRSVPPT